MQQFTLRPEELAQKQGLKVEDDLKEPNH